MCLGQVSSDLCYQLWLFSGYFSRQYGYFSMETFRIGPTLGRLSYRAQIWTSVLSNNFGYFSGYFYATMAIFRTNIGHAQTDEKRKKKSKKLKIFEKIGQNLNFCRRKIAILAWKKSPQLKFFILWTLVTLKLMKKWRKTWEFLKKFDKSSTFAAEK